MKRVFTSLFTATALLCMIACGGSQAELPDYLNPKKDIEVRIDDAMSRMTLDEKIAIIHAQSKFSSAGVPRLGIPEL